MRLPDWTRVHGWTKNLLTDGLYFLLELHCRKVTTNTKKEDTGLANSCSVTRSFELQPHFGSIKVHGPYIVCIGTAYRASTIVTTTTTTTYYTSLISTSLTCKEVQLCVW